jgi:hypothetical protein
MAYGLKYWQGKSHSLRNTTNQERLKINKSYTVLEVKTKP